MSTMNTSKYRMLIDASEDSLMNDNIPESIRRLVASLHAHTEPTNNSDFTPPPWFDKTKYKTGQECAQKYFFNLCHVEMLSLMMLFSYRGGLNPLIYTNKSGDPYTAFRRYLSTIDRVRSWYRTDIFDSKSDAGRNISVVRSMHKNIKERMSAETLQEIERKLHENLDNICCPMLPILKEDFTKNITPPELGQCPHNSIVDSNKMHLDQFTMSLTQFGFVGLFILFPHKIGAANATEKELDGFVHLWALIGYLLGIDDKYNFCIGGLNDCRQMSWDVISTWIKPNFRELRPEWEHMTRCVTRGVSFYTPGVNFETSVLFLCWLLEIPVPNLTVAINWRKRALFYLQRFVYSVILKLPGNLTLFNWLLHRSIDRAIHAPASWLERIKRQKHIIN